MNARDISTVVALLIASAILNIMGIPSLIHGNIRALPMVLLGILAALSSGTFVGKTRKLARHEKMGEEDQ